MSDNASHCYMARLCGDGAAVKEAECFSAAATSGDDVAVTKRDEAVRVAAYKDMQSGGTIIVDDEADAYAGEDGS